MDPGVRPDIATPAALRRDMGAYPGRQSAMHAAASGTTGLPKAANVIIPPNNAVEPPFAGIMDLRPSDRMYNCLPIFSHTASAAWSNRRDAGQRRFDRDP